MHMVQLQISMDKLEQQVAQVLLEAQELQMELKK
jgi:hypothetical protein